MCCLVICIYQYLGHDTTAHTLAWAAYFVASYPEVEAKLLEEIDSVFGGIFYHCFAEGWKRMTGLLLMT